MRTEGTTQTVDDGLALGTIGVLAAGVVAAYWLVVRPWYRNWGATPAEVDAQLPGDDLLADPDGESTMAVTIDAPAGEVWPWLVQLGQGRGGFYSYEWAENLVGLDVHNADRILPAYQDLSVGDTVRLGDPERWSETRLVVADLEPNRALVLRTPAEPTDWTWAFVLAERADGSTRFVVRSRAKTGSSPVSAALVSALLEPVASLMTRKMLLGVRERAERVANEPTSVTG